MMRRPLILAASLAAFGLAGLGFAGVAAADEDECSAPMADWQPREALRQLAEKQGWTDGRVRAENGCYAIQALDSEGRGVKARVDPETLAVLKVAQEHEDEHEHEDGEEDDDGGGRGPRAAAAGTVAPPDNGLFRKGGAGVVMK